MVWLAVGVVVALVAVSTVLGLVARARAGRVRVGAADRVDLAALDVAGGAAATLLQLSTSRCATCRPTAALLGRVAAAASPAVAHAEVLLDDRPDLVERFAIRQTPTTLLLDARGTVRGRIGGAPREAEVVSALAVILEEPHVPTR